MKKKSQKEVILELLQHGDISTVLAVKNRILRLSERVRELIRDGHNIETYFKRDKKGRTIRYAFYRLVK